MLTDARGYVAGGLTNIAGITASASKFAITREHSPGLCSLKARLNGFNIRPTFV